MIETDMEQRFIKGDNLGFKEYLHVGIINGKKVKTRIAFPVIFFLE